MLASESYLRSRSTFLEIWAEAGFVSRLKGPWLRS